MSKKLASRLGTVIFAILCMHTQSKADRIGNAYPLHFAAALGQANVTKLLLKHNANPFSMDRDGDTALHMAATQGHEKICRILINAGAERDKQNLLGNGPMHNAAAKGHIHVIRALLYHSGLRIGDAPYAVIDLANETGVRPLHYAAAHGHTEAVLYLIKSDALVTSFDRAGNGMLHFGAWRNQEKLFTKLIQYHCGLKANFINSLNLCPKQVAEFFGNNEVCQYLAMFPVLSPPLGHPMYLHNR